MAKKSTRRTGSSAVGNHGPVYLSVGRSAKPGSGKSTEKPIKIDPALDPELYATTLQTIGLSHTAAGNYTEALEQLQVSFEFHTRLYGPDHPSIIDCRLYLAEVLRRLGDLTAARTMIEAAVSRARGGRGASTIQLGLVLNELAALESEHNKLVAAHPTAVESRRLLEAAGDPHRTLAMDTLARIHVARGEYVDARDIYRAMLEIDSATYLGTNHPRYVAHLHNLAIVLQALGDSADAAKSFKKVAETLQQLHGDLYPDLGAVYANMGRLAQSRKRFGDAEKHFLAALKLSKKLLGEKHPFYGYDLANLARLALDRDEPKTARKYLEDALAIYENAFKGQAHVYTASALTFLAYAQLLLGKPDEAKTSIARAIELWNEIARLCNERAGDAGTCDRAFAEVLRDLADAAAKPRDPATTFCLAKDSDLHHKLQAGDIRHRLLKVLIKKGLIREDKAVADSEAPSVARVTKQDPPENEAPVN